MAVAGRDVLLVEKLRDKHYAVVTINRQERGNSISFDLAQRLGETWLDLRQDDDIWAIVLTASGDRFFSSGNDLKERSEIDQAYPGGFTKFAEDNGGFGRINPYEHELWKPIICAINGYAMAGGFYLAQMSDVRIAVEHAMFGIPEVRWNLPAPYAAQLQRLISPALALEMTLWGARQYSAERMREAGFVNKVVADGTALLAEAQKWAEEVCQNGPVSVWTHKELMFRYLNQDAGWSERFSLAMFDKVLAMDDSVEGPRAFAEKRQPKWTLR
jgi:enoyl-CoA hydratase/carnithine racemase